MKGIFVFDKARLREAVAGATGRRPLGTVSAALASRSSEPAIPDEFIASLAVASRGDVER